jgi:hypothetical protein
MGNRFLPMRVHGTGSHGDAVAGVDLGVNGAGVRA